MIPCAASGRRWGWAVLEAFLALTLATPCAAATTLEGFVTRVDSPTDFYVGALHVMLNGKAQCETQDLGSDIQIKGRGFLGFSRYFLLQSRPDPKSELAAPCDALSLKVGSRVQVAGDRRPQDSSFTAAHLIVYKVDIQLKSSASWNPPEWSGAALLEEKPQVNRTAQGWSGTLWLNGYPMTISPSTKLLAAPDVKQMGIGDFDWLKGLYKETILHRRKKAPAPAFSASLFQPNTWATYRGARSADGNVLLDRIGLWPNRPYSRWEKYSAEFVPTIQPSNYASQASGSAVFAGGGFERDTVLTILADRNVQEYVSRLGASLVPRYQENMPETNATKVHFRFYVVQSTGAAFDNAVIIVDSLSSMAQPSWDDAVLALPNGMIFVPTSTLIGIGSEAQLAAILSSAIASVLQKQSCIASYESSQAEGDQSDPIFSGMNFAAFTYGFVLWRDEQALRIGIRQMYLAGYDIREAPVAWAAAIGKPFANPLTDPAQSAAGVPWYTAYAFNYISQFYSDVDYSKLKRGEAEYAEFLKELRNADPAAFQHGGE
jgi:hypothetical protein